MWATSQSSVQPVSCADLLAAVRWKSQTDAQNCGPALRQGNRLQIWTPKCPTKGAHKGRPYQLSIVFGQETELREGTHKGRPYQLSIVFGQETELREGAHKGRPYQLSIVFGQETELREGAHKGRPYQLSIVFGQETELREGTHKGRPYQLSIGLGRKTDLQEGTDKGCPYDDFLFSAVFSELGSNRVVSRVLAQLDAIAPALRGQPLHRRPGACTILEIGPPLSSPVAEFAPSGETWYGFPAST